MIQFHFKNTPFFIIIYLALSHSQSSQSSQWFPFVLWIWKSQNCVGFFHICNKAFKLHIVHGFLFKKVICRQASSIDIYLINHSIKIEFKLLELAFALFIFKLHAILIGKCIYFYGHEFTGNKKIETKHFFPWWKRKKERMKSILFGLFYYSNLNAKKNPKGSDFAWKSNFSKRR